MLILLSLMFGTLVSEDLACVTAGLLIQRGQVDAASAIAACALGITAGDIGLWGVGRVCGQAALAMPWVTRGQVPGRVDQLRSWLDRHAGGAIVASRFLPGTRLPLYVIAGLLRLPAAVFAGWAVVGALLWTPILVLVSAGVGHTLSGPASMVIERWGLAWMPPVVTAASVLAALFFVRSRPWRRLVVS